MYFQIRTKNKAEARADAGILGRSIKGNKIEGCAGLWKAPWLEQKAREEVLGLTVCPGTSHQNQKGSPQNPNIIWCFLKAKFQAASSLRAWLSFLETTVPKALGRLSPPSETKMSHCWVLDNWWHWGWGAPHYVPGNRETGPYLLVLSSPLFHQNILSGPRQAALLLEFSPSFSLLPEAPLGNPHHAETLTWNLASSLGSCSRFCILVCKTGVRNPKPIVS